MENGPAYLYMPLKDGDGWKKLYVSINARAGQWIG